MLSVKGVIRAVKGTIREIEIKRYYQKEPRFSGAYSRNILPKIKNGLYVMNLDGYKSIETHCIAFDVNCDNLTFFDSFGVEYFSKEIKKHIGDKNIKANNVWIHFFCIYLFYAKT